MSASERIRVAMVGCGDVSSVHLSAIDSFADAELVGVCDTDEARCASAASVHGVPGFADLDELIRDLRPDVVHIATPHDQHASLAITALENGVNVILEKPLAHTRPAARELVAVAQRSSARIGVCLQNRYNAPVQAAQRLLASGATGRILGGSGTVIWMRTPDYYRERPWRGRWASGGGGLLMNQAIHTIDLLQWLIGDVVDTRGAVATRAFGDIIEVEDTADLLLEHSGGARSVFYATLAASWNEPVTISILTERATLSLRGTLTVTWNDGRVETVAERSGPPGARDYWGTSHALLIRDFYDTLGDTEPFWISPTEAQKSLEIAQSAYAVSGIEVAG